METEPNLNCRNASRLLSLACERPLDAGELRALRRHLEKCLMCANFEAQLNLLRKASKRFGTGGPD